MTRKPQRIRALERQIARIDQHLATLTQLSSRMAAIRLVVFASAVVISGILWAVGSPLASGIAGLVGGIAFIMAARQHRQIKRARLEQTLWRRIKREHLARMRLEWDQLPPPQFAAPRDDHPLERDLDLVGDRALHRLIDTTIARESSARLRDWLAAPVTDPVITLHRQNLTRELVPLTVFRDKLHLYGALDSSGRARRWSGSPLVDWITGQTPVAAGQPVLRVLLGLAVLNAALVILSLLGFMPPVWRLTLLIYGGVYLWCSWRLGDLFTQAQALGDPLRDLQAVFTHLEHTPYRPGSALGALCAPFTSRRQRPSAELGRLTRVISLASIRGNPWLWMAFSVVIPWDLLVAQALDRRRAALAQLLPQWLDTWAELEALSALATLAYLNPDCTFPEIITTPNHSGPLVTAQEIGHPLIPDDQRVCNSISFERHGNMALITGSNMSGKSTFLRTLGLNLCLAHAGGPVTARVLQVVPLRLYSCLRVTDSVTDGISYFYAEVKCLKGLLDQLQAANATPVFYLIDEIFRGTNNRERLIGSRAYIRALAAQRGVGALSTHDLELVHLVDEMPTITNYHFAESIGEGRLLFDYSLRQGPCPTTNALKIMAFEGLPLPTGDSEQTLPGAGV